MLPDLVDLVALRRTIAAVDATHRPSRSSPLLTTTESRDYLARVVRVVGPSLGPPHLPASWWGRIQPRHAPPILARDSAPFGVVVSVPDRDQATVRVADRLSRSLLRAASSPTPARGSRTPLLIAHDGPIVLQGFQGDPIVAARTRITVASGPGRNRLALGLPGWSPLLHPRAGAEVEAVAPSILRARTAASYRGGVQRQSPK